MIKFEVTGTGVLPIKTEGTIQSTYCTLDFQVIASPPTHFSQDSESIIASWNVDLKYRNQNSAWQSLSIVEPVEVTSGDSIQQAVGKVPPGASILVHPGKYIENLHITKPVHIISKSSSHIFGQIVVDASNVTLNGFTFYSLDLSLSTITVTSLSSASFILNCRFTGTQEMKSLSDTESAAAVNCAGCSELSLVNNIVENWKHGLQVDKDSSITVQSNVFRSCKTAITISHTSTASLIRNLFVENVVAIRIQQLDSMFQAQLNTEGNVFERNLVTVEPSVLGGNVSLGSLGYTVGPTFGDETGLMLLSGLALQGDLPPLSLRDTQRLTISGTCQNSKDPTSEYCSTLHIQQDQSHCDCSSFSGKNYVAHLMHVIIQKKDSDMLKCLFMKAHTGLSVGGRDSWNNDCLARLYYT